MATERWIAGSGVGLTWTACFTPASDINSLANGNAMLSASAGITNGTSLDIFADVSFLAGAAVTTVVPAYLGLYLYPLGQDGSTYGDGRFTGSGGAGGTAGPPPGNYAIGNAAFAAAASTTIACVWSKIVLVPGTFKFLIYNQSGVALPASGNLCLYRTYNRSVA
jgi:hypothetical protein